MRSKVNIIRDGAWSNFQTWREILTSNEYPRRLPAIFSIKLTKLKRNRGSPAQRKQNTSPLTKTRLPKKMGRPNTLRVSIFFAKNGQPNKKWKPDCQQIKRLSFSSVHKTNPQKWHLFPNTSSSVCKNASFFPINLITQIFAFPKTNCRLMIFTPSKMRVIRSWHDPARQSLFSPCSLWNPKY